MSIPVDSSKLRWRPVGQSDAEIGNLASDESRRRRITEEGRWNHSDLLEACGLIRATESSFINHPEEHFIGKPHILIHERKSAPSNPWCPFGKVAAGRLIIAEDVEASPGDAGVNKLAELAGLCGQVLDLARSAKPRRISRFCRRHGLFKIWAFSWKT